MSNPKNEPTTSPVLPPSDTKRSSGGAADRGPTISSQLQQLDELIAWFDQNDFDLDEALKKFDQGIKLTEQIEVRLSKLENKITVLKQKFDINSGKAE